ncbi:MAG TPA: hypothetical protein VIG99_08355 [Myxococcaceae bacterium]|jgi:hypothetical protein
MDFLERWVGFAPDGGNGATELALLMASACAVLAVVLWRRRRIGVRTSVRS